MVSHTSWLCYSWLDLSSVSTTAQAMSAVADIARFRLVEEFRLVDVVASGSVLPIPETTESTYYDDDETTERANVKTSGSIIMNWAAQNPQLSEGSSY